MHGSSYNSDCAGLLRSLADMCEQTLCCGPAATAQPLPRHPGPLG